MKETSVGKRFIVLISLAVLIPPFLDNPGALRAQEEAAPEAAFAAQAGAVGATLSSQIQTVPLDFGAASSLNPSDLSAPRAGSNPGAAMIENQTVSAAVSSEKTVSSPPSVFASEAEMATPAAESHPQQQLQASAKNHDSFLERVFFGRPNNSPGGDPPGFGAPEGLEIANKDRILDEINQALGTNRPPDFEAVWVRPFPVVRVFNLGFGTNPFGHIAMRYTKADGTQKFMNIVGVKGHEMVNFLKPEDYFYGTHGFILPQDKANPDYQRRAEEQGGVYNRGMFGLRIEKLPPETLVQLDDYFNHLMTLAEEDKSKFSLGASEMLNDIDRLIGSRTRYGNCALWNSSGMAAAGMLKSPNFWPKKVWVELYEKYKKLDPANVHVVAYRHITQAVQTFSPDVDMNGLVSPWNWIKNFRYWNLERRADVIVAVPKGSTTARVLSRAKPRPAAQ